MRKLVSTIIAFCCVAVFSACSTPSAPSASSVKAPTSVSSPTVEVPVVDVVPASYDGTWRSDPKFMVAEIKGNLIVINIVTEDSTALFWKGSWPMGQKPVDGAKIDSKADVAALSVSLMGSMEKSKPFAYNNGELTFSFSMMGVAKTVHVKK